MSSEVEREALALVREIRDGQSSLSGTMSDMRDVLTDIEGHMDAIDIQVAVMGHKMDRMEARLDSIDRRLGLLNINDQ